MLPFMYSAGQNSQNHGQNVQSQPQTYGVDFLTDFYRNYEQQQQGLQQTQQERLREREETMKQEQNPESRSRSRSRSRRRSSSRSRSCSRSRSRSYHRSRSRDRRRSRSRSRDRHYRSRSRSRSRSRDRVRRYRGRSRSPRRRSRSRSWDRDRRRERDDRDYQSAPPSNKLAMMSLPNDIDRNMITMVMAADGFTPNDVRVVHRGTARSFGFIDFADVDSAVKWMDYNKGWLTLNDGRRIAVNYAKPDPASSGRPSNNDWICANCTCNNFFKRDKCFKCETSKAQSDDMERAGMHMIGVVPCDTLLIRNLSAGVTTASIFEGLIKNVNLSCIIQLQLADSKQYAYIQMRSPDDALALFNSSYKAPIKVMNQDAILTYCKLPLREIIRQEQLAQRALLSQPLPSNGQPISGAEVAHAAMMRLAQNRGELPPQQKNQYYRPAPAQIPVPSPMALKPGVVGTTQTPQGTLPKYAVPNPASFVLDGTTGYFRDPVTGFLYDPKSGYYFMQDNNVWACWDATYETYFNMSATTSDPKAEPVEDSKKTESEKKAADAMKQMQKWQKKQEKQKLQITLKPLGKGLDGKSAFEKQGTSEDLEDVELPKKEKYKKSVDDEDEPVEDSHLENPQLDISTMATELEQMEREWIDEAKKICRLCNRAFPSVDVLMKHVEKSDLHRKNAEEKRSELARKYVNTSVPEEEPEHRIVYRDRAKERRAQYGLDGGYGKEDRQDSFAPRSLEVTKRDSETVASKPLDSNNIGNKLLRNMGWKEGEGAGKYGQGIVNPIEAVRRVQGAGLGSAGSTVVHSSETSHKERVRASMMNRFKEISEQ